MTAAEKKAYKAKQLRYKKPIARGLNIDTIQSELWDMISACEDIHWYDNNEESLVSALDGDEDEAYEFKMAFSDLEAELEQFQEDLDSGHISDYFDVFFPAAEARYAGGYLGFDQYEGDYYGLEPYEYSFAENEAAKKIMSLTKKEILKIVGQCLKIAYQYMAVRYRYDCLEAAIEILRGENMERIKIVNGIEEQYLIAEKISDGFRWNWNEDVRKLDYMILQVPQEYWIQ
ncbi:hypothetical protein D7X48_12575 [bacterium D16-50]|nr:hypothetical protein D7X48_12575 [bacterium D16-50]